MSQLPADLLAILVCPRCRNAFAVESTTLRCDTCRVGYPVEDGVPMLRLEDAQPLSEAHGAG